MFLAGGWSGVGVDIVGCEVLCVCGVLVMCGGVVSEGCEVVGERGGGGNWGGFGWGDA